MIKTENKVFKQFANLTSQVIEDGADKLDKYLEMGDWMLLVVNRGYLAELELTDAEQLELERLDTGL